MMKQSDAVFQAVSKTFATHEGQAIPETGRWTTEQKQEVYGTLLTMFQSGEVTKASGGTDDASLMKYIPGLVNNPGSRTGSGDESIKAMRALLSGTTDPAVKNQIQTLIDARLEELKPKAVINVDALPEALRHLVG